jgi:hypothetical protein
MLILFYSLGLILFFRDIALSTFLDARFKDRLASNKNEFQAKVLKWIVEESNEETIGS